MPGILIFVCFCVTVWGLWSAGSIHLQPKIKTWYFRNVLAGATALFMGLLVIVLMNLGWFGVLVGLAITGAAAFAPERQRKMAGATQATPSP